MDANTQALNKHLNDQSEAELVQEHFESRIQDELDSIEKLIGSINRIAKGYEGYDFTDVIKERILEML